MLNIFEDLQQVSRAAAKLISDAAKKNISAKGNFSLVLSGGETPKRLYETLAEKSFRKKIQWERVKVFFGDERYVPYDDEKSNFRMANETLLRHVAVLPQNIFPIPTSSFPHEDAMKYEATLRNNFPFSFPQFDLVLLGLGENGHTASLFPHTNVLHEREKWAKEVFVEEQKNFRITLTAIAINAASQIVFLVSGKNKSEVLQRVLSGERNPEELPAQLIDPYTGELTWMIDKAAAGIEEE